MTSGITVTSNPDPAQLQSLGVMAVTRCALEQGIWLGFDAGLSCTWEVHAPVRKPYRFG